MFDGMVEKYKKLSPSIQTALVTLRNFVLLYAGMMAENQVQVISKGEWFPQEWSHAAILFSIFIVVGLGSHQIRMAQERLNARRNSRIETLVYAESLIDQYVTETCRTAELAIEENGTSLVAAFVASPSRIQQLVTKVYQVFESRFAESGQMQNRINFKVTFMTKSFRDGEITIPAYANRAGRAPTSMQERPARPKLYENTVTASIYREPHPKMQIIPDTHDKTVRYAELYAGQKDRIRSSIVYPILSSQNKLLGTLVVHCDRPCFFAEDERKFWEDLLHIFARRLAYEKVKIDAVHGPEKIVARLTHPAQQDHPF